MWGWLADAVVLLHLLFIAFASLGALLVLRWPRLSWLHLPALGWALWITISNRICPLTPLENYLRQRAGQDGYQQGFIDHYVMPIIYPPGLTPALQMSIGVILLLGNIAMYGWIVQRHRQRRASSGDPA